MTQKVDYNPFAHTFSESRRNMRWKEIQYCVEHCLRQLGHTSTIGDMGCGNGRLLDELDRQGWQGIYQGVDISEKMIEEAKLIYTKQQFFIGDMTQFVYQNPLDALFCIAGFHHLDTPQKRIDTLQNMFTSIRSGGYIYMTNWNLLSPTNTIKYGKYQYEQQEFEIKIGDYTRYYHAFTLTELESLFQQFHYTIVEHMCFEEGNNIVSILQRL